MDLIVALLTRANWARAKAHIQPEMMGKKLAPIVHVIDTMYDADPALTELDVENVRIAFFKDRTGLKLSEIEGYNTIFDRVAEERTGTPSRSFEDLMEGLLVAEAMAEIASEAAAGMSKPEVAALDRVSDIVERTEKALMRSDDPDDVFITTGNIEEPGTKDGLRFPLFELDRAAGPLDQGDFVWIAGRMEMGKSTLLAQIVAAWATSAYHPDRPILWINNEERSEKLLRRVIQSYYGLTTSALLTDFPKYRTMFQTVVPSNRLLITKQGEHNSVREIDALCATYKPCAIIGDQWDKIAGYGKAERDDLRLGLLAGWGRRLAAKWGPVVAVSQLDFLAEGQRFPSMANMRGSKVDKAAEADLILTIGAEDRSNPTRGFSVEKNKLDGADDAHRHDKFELAFDPIRARFYGGTK